MHKNAFIKGTRIDLIALSEEIALRSNWYSWFNDEIVTANLQKHYFPNTRELQLEFYRREIAGRHDILQLGIVPHGSEELSGVVSLGSIDYINRKAEVAMVIGDARSRNLETTLEAMRLIIIHGFYTLNLRRIYGGTIAREWAVLLCRTLGFREEGVFREDVYKDGGYRDVYRVSVLEPEFAVAIKHGNEGVGGSVR